ncbi:MAG: hypothetical protein M1814_004385 [Vezdaea aestivalis]|nr:MAG: hypothetical protein M1814_004385 [Vezdaea aestivalis]
MAYLYWNRDSRWRDKRPGEGDEEEEQEDGALIRLGDGAAPEVPEHQPPLSLRPGQKETGVDQESPKHLAQTSNSTAVSYPDISKDSSRAGQYEMTDQGQGKRTASPQRVVVQPKNSNSSYNARQGNSRSSGKDANARIARLTSDLNDVMAKNREWNQAYANLTQSYEAAVERCEGLAVKVSGSDAQVQALQQEQLAGRDRFQPITDGALSSAMEDLNRAVKTLATTTKSAFSRKVSNSDFEAILQEGKWLWVSKVDKNVWKKRKAQKFLLESAIWDIVHQLYFKDPWSSYSHCSRIRECWRALGDDKRIGNPAHYPDFAEEYQRWRSVTADFMNKTGGFASNRDKDSRDFGEIIKIPKSFNIMEGALEQCESETWEIIRASKRLGTMMSQQRCKLEINFPSMTVLRTVAPAEWSSLEEVCDKEAETTKGIGHNPLYVVSPTLLKWGNGAGQRLEELTILVPATVLTEFDDEE